MRLLLCHCALLVACGSDDLDIGSDTPPPPHVACDNRALDSTCADYADGTPRRDATESCSGVVIEARWPTENAVGSCTVTTAVRGDLTNTYYSDGSSPQTEESARESCTSATGTFRKP